MPGRSGPKWHQKNTIKTQASPVQTRFFQMESDNYSKRSCGEVQGLEVFYYP